MTKIKKFSFLLALLLLSLFFSRKTFANEDVFEMNFQDNQMGNWTQLVGSTDINVSSNQLIIKNTTVGSNIESAIVSTDSPNKKDGEILLDFFYEDQKNISVLFRASTTEKYKWQAFAYNDDGKWTFGEPGGKWISNIVGPKLESGNNYKLVVKYNKTGISAYLDGKLFYENNDVIYPNNEEISQWEGKVGLRLFGNRSTLKINSLKSGAVGAFTKEFSDSVENDVELKMMRDRWKNSVVGDFSKNEELLKDNDVVKYINNLSEESDELFTTLNKDSDRTILWEKKDSDTNSANVTIQFKKIQVLAKAYATPNTTLYMNNDLLKEIISALDFMTTKGQYTGEKYFGNWWDWQIGVPQEFIPTLMIIYDDVPKEKMSNYTQILSKYLPNPYQQMYGKPQSPAIDLSFIPNFSNSGANRTDHALSIVGIGILEKNSYKIVDGVTSIKEVFETVKSGDGFYEDGSFIQHTDIPYNGSYGNVLIKGVGKIFSIVDQTQWQLDDVTVNSFVSNVEKAFIPLLYNGETMAMVNGRSISRAPSANKIGFGSPTIYNLLITAQFANEESKKHLEEASKYWMLQNKEYYLNSTRDFNDLMLTKQLLAKNSVIGQKNPFSGSRMYGAMDRFVYSDETNSIGLSLYSNRTSSFEAINQENLKGWHSSDGMVYLYNSDQQFGGNYWPTVDYYRLPGTTVNTAKMNDEMAFKPYRSTENHVGGVSDGENAAIAMQLNKKDSLNNGKATDNNLKAKKSWFVLDKKLINLGTDINGTTNDSIETVIENRLLDNQATYKFMNQEGQDASNQKTSLVKKDSWYLLEADKDNHNIGYYMLQDQTISTLRETRSGTYKEINVRFPSDELYSEDYQKVLVAHGKDVKNGSYAYITYPNATKEELISLSENKYLQVVSNTKDVQSVKDTKNNVIAANIWNDEGAEVEGIKVNKAVSLISCLKEGNIQKISISNPKQTQETVELRLPSKVKMFESKNEAVSLKDDNQTVIVNTSNSLGATFEFTVEYDDINIPVEQIELGNNSLEIVKKNSTIELKASVIPSEATDADLTWRVEKPSIATIENEKLIAKKVGTTTVIVSSKNGIEKRFVLRVTP